MSREDLSNAILSYKLGILSKLLDDIQVVFIQFEKNPVYNSLVRNLRQALSERFNLLEDNILKSGGVLNRTTTIDAEVKTDSEKEIIDQQNEPDI